MRRREFIAGGVGGVAAVSLGAVFWDDLLGDAQSRPLRRGSGYGPMRKPDANGIRLPEGFRSREIARGKHEIAGYEWHLASDGSATFPTRDGGFVFVSNSEVLDGGASAIRFDAAGEARDAYRILGGTAQNCSGGGTPWGTWLSCEEVEDGRVWECDPAGRRKAVVHDAMGVFKHEAAAVDPVGKRVYLTEDLIDGGFYRFTPRRWHDLSEGLLEIARVGRGGTVEWVRVPDPLARKESLRDQVRGSTRLKRGEGTWREGRTVFVATTADSRIHAYDISRECMSVIYDGLASASAPLIRVDGLTGSRGGEVFVCEDVATEEIHIGVIDAKHRASRFLAVTGREHEGSELTGATFDPTGSRLFFSSQRAHGGDGAIYEVTGPFRGRRTRSA